MEATEARRRQAVVNTPNSDQADPVIRPLTPVRAGLCCHKPNRFEPSSGGKSVLTHTNRHEISAAIVALPAPSALGYLRAPTPTVRKIHGQR